MITHKSGVLIHECSSTLATVPDSTTTAVVATVTAAAAAATTVVNVVASELISLPETTPTIVVDNSNNVFVTHNSTHDDFNCDDEDDGDDVSSTVSMLHTKSVSSAFEEGLADDDSWVENLSHDDGEVEDEEEEEEDEEGDNDDDEDESDDVATSSSSDETITLTCSASLDDHEDDLRGFHRTAIDFTLHTIVEESCEDSEVDQPNTIHNNLNDQLATDLEKYFFFRLADANASSSSSLIPVQCEDTMSESSSGGPNSLSAEEGVCTPTQQHQQQPLPPSLSSSQSDHCSATSKLENYFLTGFMGFKNDRRDSDGSVGSDSEGKPSPEQRRKRLVRARGAGRLQSSSMDNLLVQPDSDGGAVDASHIKNISRNNTSPDRCYAVDVSKTDSKQISPSHVETARDSGFVGSCDDLEQKGATPSQQRDGIKNVNDERSIIIDVSHNASPASEPLPSSNLIRKDSFNNWSSDEETNIMMGKMRQLFRSMIRPSVISNTASGGETKSPQLLYFESELGRLMKSVPGIKDEQVREIVEYFSSEDAWSDSYDSSDYTGSDREQTHPHKLQLQISDSCREIIHNFDPHVSNDDNVVYHNFIQSFEQMTATEETNESSSSAAAATHNSPSLLAKVMQNIGTRLVSLMHEVQSNGTDFSNSRTKHYYKKFHKPTAAGTTTPVNEYEDNYDSADVLAHSKSYEQPLNEQENTHIVDTIKADNSTERIDERSETTSDSERFSWRGSFESALLVSDSRHKLTALSYDLAAAKRRSAGDLLLAHNNLSREQLDRVRSCGSIGAGLSQISSIDDGGGRAHDRWSASSDEVRKVLRQRSHSVYNRDCCSESDESTVDDAHENADMAMIHRHMANDRYHGVVTGSGGVGNGGGGSGGGTLPRSLVKCTAPASTNSLPRLPTASTSLGSTPIQKSQSMCYVSPPNVRSARYRAPGFASKLVSVLPKRAFSVPVLPPSFRSPPVSSSRERARKPHYSRHLTGEHSPNFSDALSSTVLESPRISNRSSHSETPSPVIPRCGRSASSTTNSICDDDPPPLHPSRVSLSSLGMRSESMASIYSGAGESRYRGVPVKGDIEFGMQYNYKAGALEICIKRCKELSAVDLRRNRSDPYVKVYLLPDKSKSGKRKTKVKKHTLNPVFDEILRFHISLQDVKLRTLWLTVWHSDMFGRNNFLGEVTLALEHKVFDDPTPMWHTLQERTESFDDMLAFKGDIIVCLKFVPPDITTPKRRKSSRGCLQVLVKEAKNLPAVKASGLPDSFCKSYLLPDRGRSYKQKTAVVRRTVNPVWNHTFTYDDITLQELSERCLELTVWDHDRLTSNEFLGGVRFSLGTGKYYGKPVEWMDAAGKEHYLWKNMLERPNLWVEGCVALRPTLEGRI